MAIEFKYNDAIRKKIDRWKRVQAQHGELLKASASRAQGAATQFAESEMSNRLRVPSRKGRPSGSMVDNIFYEVARDTVRLDYARLNAATAIQGGNYWMIQELGTGRSGSMVEYLPGGGLRIHSVAIPAQTGRKISPGLVFLEGGTGIDGPRSDSDRTGQLIPFSNAPESTDAERDEDRRTQASRFRMVTPPDGTTIGVEIKGKHFIQRGTALAARDYRRNLFNLVREATR